MRMTENNPIEKLKVKFDIPLTLTRSSPISLEAKIECNRQVAAIKLRSLEGMITLDASDNFLGRFQNVVVALVEDKILCFTLWQ